MFALLFKKAAFAAVICAGLSVSPAYAQFEEVQSPLAAEGEDSEFGGTADSGVIGSDDNRPAAARPNDDSDLPPSLPAVFDGAATPAAAEEEDEGPDENDPCAAYEDGDGYNMCQDRIRKIERMRDAKNRRMGTEPAPVQAAPAKTSTDKASEAVDKVEELEKRLKEKEELEAAKKAAPTTKKNIGGFERNPEKGTPLFK